MQDGEAELRAPPADSRWRVERVVPIYLVLGVLWVLVTAPSVEHVAEWSHVPAPLLILVEGLAFVLATAVLLTRKLRRWIAEREAAWAVHAQAADRDREVQLAKEAFVQAISHEIRTPLSAAHGLAATLRRHADGMEPDQRRDLLERLERNTLHLHTLLMDLVEVGRLTRGDPTTLEPRHADLSAIALRVAETIPPAGRVLVTDAPGPVHVLVDVPKMERVIETLLANAITHTPEGTTIWLRVRMSDAHAHVVVDDAGPGVPEGLRESIFEPFTQGPDRHREARPGMGIGLSLARWYVELHDGTIWVDERPGGGTRIVVALPPHPDVVVARPGHADSSSVEALGPAASG